MERTLVVCDSFEAAEALDLQQWQAIPGRERLLAGEELREEWARREGQSGI
jgi:hypothetical protein